MNIHISLLNCSNIQSACFYLLPQQSLSGTYIIVTFHFEKCMACNGLTLESNKTFIKEHAE